MMENTVLSAILEVFTAIATWLSSAVTSVSSMFFASGELTFLGGLAVAGLGFSVVFLVMGVIQNFLHFRG